MGVINDLKRFNAEATSLDDTVALAAQARALTTEFDTRNVTHPEWLDDVNRRLGAAIATQTREAKELRLREIRAQRTQLMTASEKRTLLEAEEAALLAEISK